MNENAKWIRAEADIGEISPEFVRRIVLGGKVASARAMVSAMGVYELTINQKKVGNGILTPGFTSYPNRVLFQEYDITPYLSGGENRIGILGGKGWALGGFGNSGGRSKNFADNISVIAHIEIV